MEQQTPWWLAEPPRAAPDPALRSSDEVVGRGHRPGGRVPPRQSFIKRRLAPIGAALIALVTKLTVLLLLLHKASFVCWAAVRLSELRSAGDTGPYSADQPALDCPAG